MVNLNLIGSKDVTKTGLNQTHSSLISRMAPPMDECKSPSTINKLLRLDKRDLRKSLYEIKHNKLSNNDGSFGQTVNGLHQLNSGKVFDGSRTFVSEPEIKSIKKRNGQVRSKLVNKLL